MDYVERHPRSIAGFESWLETLKRADWNSPVDMQETFNTADLLGKGCQRVVFNIAGNHYRIICKYHFGEEQVHLFVCWIGTHAEYDKLNRKSEQYTINSY